MKVALKYCGGCDPGYERVDYYQAVKRAAGDGIEWTTLDAGGWDAVLLICGCESACPEDELPAGARVIKVTDDSRPPEEVARLLMEMVPWT